jgi:sugar lactone lactonase YvrE
MNYLKFLTILGLVLPLTGMVECLKSYSDRETILLAENRDKIENTESLKNIVAENSRLEKVATGFKFTEGAVWHRDGFLLFSDIPASTIYRWQEGKEATIFRRPSQNANGNAFDRQGRLISAQHGDRLLSRTEKDGKVLTLVDRYEGKRLNSPNDLAIRSDGSIYFTDPPYGIDAKKEELVFMVFIVFLQMAN